MAQYNVLNVKFYNLQLNELKSAMKNGTGLALNLSSNDVGDSNDENNFPHKLLPTITQDLGLRKAFCKWFISYYKIIKNSIG